MLYQVPSTNSQHSVLNPAQEDVSPAPAVTPTPAFSGATAVGTDVPFTSGVILGSIDILIPAIATTAQFVTPGGANTTAGTASATSTPEATPTASEFPGAAGKVNGALGGAVIGLGMALML